MTNSFRSSSNNSHVAPAKVYNCLIITIGCIRTFSTANQNPCNTSIVVILQIRQWKTLKVKYTIDSMTSSKPSSPTDQNSTTSFTRREGTPNRSRPDPSIWVFPIMMKESRFLGNLQTWATIGIRRSLGPSRREELTVHPHLSWWKLSNTPRALLWHLRRCLRRSWPSS